MAQPMVLIVNLFYHADAAHVVMKTKRTHRRPASDVTMHDVTVDNQ